ncbi:hypothetical protein B2G71_20815 [Novosphingobium sp. PC22D]|uniref:lipopolysaccharide biosynthesis protein n=1 Tax=Novosphingobium sp. PC22D TaxID=1962403 RepID=UPI000BF118E7|nr:hypothetical protein [Novosphingobium sp. PC22D]PEQ10750.1 hypothetical protein B2G71_20815 [Novosphingobium sp. PC22D]
MARADRTLIAGWLKLVSTNGLSGVLQFLALAIAARALEVPALGAIALIQAYVKVIDGLFNFQSVNVLTRFLAEAEHEDNRDRFCGLIKAGFLVDGATALLATLVALVLLPFAGPLAGISLDWFGPAAIYAAVILTRTFGVSEAVLRCFDQFWSIGLRPSGQAVLLFIGSLVAWTLGAGAQTFLYVWLGSEVVANLGFIGWSILVLRRRGYTKLRHADAAGAIARSERFWPLLWQTNVTFGIRLLSQDADVLIAGGVLGPAAAGLLRAAKSVAAVVTQLGRPLQQVASAPISRLSAQGQTIEMIRYAAKIGLAAGAASALLGVAAIFLGAFGLRLLFGPDFAEAAPTLVILLFAAAVLMSGVTQLPLTIALGESGLFLRSIIYGTIVFYLVVALLLGALGIAGIALAQLAFNVTAQLVCWLGVWRRRIPAAIEA